MTYLLTLSHLLKYLMMYFADSESDTEVLNDVLADSESLTDVLNDVDALSESDH
ncbi:Uncharacterised protein [Staphylococcus gallinarum]|uniref:Uncharacterized protein n=1 Tax=Staphylococcus gallinarum TaxID=1293 RepID=A0A380S9G6_STAGA|nr:Uncharacterised protein [Staphylococcus gallinarum]